MLLHLLFEQRCSYLSYRLRSSTINDFYPRFMLENTSHVSGVHFLIARLPTIAYWIDLFLSEGEKKT